MLCDICKRKLNKSNSNKAFGKILCNKHYQQILKFGHCLDSNSRTTKDLNEYVIDENSKTATIFLYNKSGEKVSETIIDLEDLDRIIVFKWRYWKGRVYTGNYKPIPIYYKILEGQIENEDFVVDHINSNPLDNRKSNLRITTQSNNVLNKSKLKNNNSDFTGVWFDKKRNKWCAEIKKNEIKCFLGRHNKKEDAVFARYIAEKIAFDEFRNETNDFKIKEEIEKCKTKKDIEEYVIRRLKERHII